MDPTAEEEALCTGLLSLTVLSDGKIAGMSKRGKYLVPQVNLKKKCDVLLRSAVSVGGRNFEDYCAVSSKSRGVGRATQNCY